MKKRFLTTVMSMLLVTTMLFSGCGSEEPTEKRTKKTHSQVEESTKDSSKEEDSSEQNGDTSAIGSAVIGGMTTDNDTTQNATQADYSQLKSEFMDCVSMEEPLVKKMAEERSAESVLPWLIDMHKKVVTYHNNAMKTLPNSEFRNELDFYYKLVEYQVTAYINVYNLQETLVGFGTELKQVAGTATTSLETFRNGLAGILTKYAANTVPQEYQAAFGQINRLVANYIGLIDKGILYDSINDVVGVQAMTSFINRINSQLQIYLAAVKSDAVYAGEYIGNSYNICKALSDGLTEGFDDIASYKKPDLQKMIITKLEYPEVIYPQQYATYDSILILHACSLDKPTEVLVEVEIPGFTQKYRETVTLNESVSKFYIKPPVLSGINVSSAKDAQLSVTITKMSDNTLLETHSYPITLKSRNDYEFDFQEFYTSDKFNILCFLEPEAPAITELKRVAADYAVELSKGSVNLTGLPGYQGSGNQMLITAYQALAIQIAMSEMGVRYIMDPYSLSGSSQRINLPSETLNKKSGLCVETALVMASALQSLNMHALLVFPPGHCQVAVETWNGSGEYLLIETTCLPVTAENSDSVVLYLNKDEWSQYLQTSDIIDCNDARILGLRGTTY